MEKISIIDKVISTILMSVDDRHLKQLIDKIPQKISGMVTINNNTPYYMKKLSIDKIIKNRKNNKHIYQILTKNFYNDVVEDDFSSYSKYLRDDLDKFAINASNDVTFYFNYFLLFLIKNKTISEINNFFLNDVDQVERIEKKIENEKSKNNKSDMDESKNIFGEENERLKSLIEKTNLRLLEEREKCRKLKFGIRANQKEILEFKKSKKEIEASLLEKSKQIEILNEEKNRKLESKIKKLEQIVKEKDMKEILLNKKIQDLDKTVGILKKKQNLKRFLVIGTLSINMQNKYPNFLFVSVSDNNEIMRNLEDELPKNYSAIFILKYQLTNSLQRSIIKHFNSVNFIDVDNIEKFTEEVKKYEI